MGRQRVDLGACAADRSAVGAKSPAAQPGRRASTLARVYARAHRLSPCAQFLALGHSRRRQAAEEDFTVDWIRAASAATSPLDWPACNAELARVATDRLRPGPRRLPGVLREPDPVHDLAHRSAAG